MKHAIISNIACYLQHIYLQLSKDCTSLTCFLRRLLNSLFLASERSFHLRDCTAQSKELKREKEKRKKNKIVQVLGPLCFRRPDVVTRVWRLASHILSAPNAPSDATAAALHAVRHAALPASCFMAPGAAVWLEAQMCLMNIPQLQRCAYMHATHA